MKKLILLLFLFLISCKDKEPTAPEETPQDQPIAEAIVGPSGGKLETEKFKLTVPAGAFSVSSQLKLFAAKKNATNTNSVTDAFRVEGIPQNYSLPLEISIKYSGTLMGINFIERGMQAEIDYIDSIVVDTVYSLFDVTEDNGYLKASIQPNTNLAKNFNVGKITDEAIPLTFEGFTNCALNFSEHFIIKSTDFDPEEYAQKFQLILQYFESAYSRFNNLGFDLTLTKWKKSITIVERTGLFEILIGSKNKSDIIIASTSELNIGPYQYYCDFFLCWIILSAYNFDNSHGWLPFGVVYWSMLKYNYWTERSKEFIIYGTIKNCLLNQKTMLATALILDHLTQSYGESILKNILSLVKNGMEPLQAIVSQTAEPKYWLSDLFESFVSGQLWLNRLKYHNPNASFVDIWNDNLSAQFGIDDTTTQITYTESYKDLSAKLYKVALLPSLKQSSILKFSAEGGETKISVFKYKNNAVEFVTRSENEITIDNVKDLQTNGYNLFVMVTNHTYPNTSASDITLKIKHNAVPTLPTITNCEIHLYGLEVNIRTYYTTGYVDGTRILDLHFYPQQAPIPTFINNIFYQAYTFIGTDGFNYWGNFSVQFSSSLDSVIAFSAEYNVDKTPVNPAYGIIKQSISGHDIRVDPQNSNLFQVNGLGVCEKIYNNVYYSQTAPSHWEVISIKECKTNTKMEIKITKQ